MLVCCNTFMMHPTAIWHFCKENKKEQYGIDTWTHKKRLGTRTIESFVNRDSTSLLLSYSKTGSQQRENTTEFEERGTVIPAGEISR